ncbi:DUF5926 family protein [Nocardioides massiliensis]|uniref:DUF5926 domain-containing protein n=1 Tax=Nocardioides massiliensis TaxID=1325935 RepID=A0ABT9NLC4_9ACTN|nr:DUF5926 family protein [Nocardioides massiliensis]MDP9821230.1 hypothetical protein [Nocardioides massiliensis]
MGKKSRVKSRVAAPAAEAEVGPRQPCPCGSGRRYKACHGSQDGPPPAFARRPFEGMPGECDVVALRELVPSATAELTVPSAGDRRVLLTTLNPGAAPALVRQDGTIWLGLQVQHAYGDPSRDLAAVLNRALEAEPGSAVGITQAPAADAPRLQDLVSQDALAVTVHDGFGWWVADLDDADGSLAAALEQANAAATPTLRLAQVEAAYWTDVGSKEHLRWAMPHDEDALLDALARLHAADRTRLVEGSRLVGMFRAHGLLVPVWDLEVGTGADALEDPAADFASALEEALAVTEPLSQEERAARSGLANRQLTIR